MRTHTKEFKEELKVFGRQIKGKIIYYPSYDLISESEDNILTEADLQIISEQANYDEPIEIDAEDIFSISIIKNGDLLQSLMKEFDFESKIELNIGSVVNPQFGLLVNEDYEYLNYGNYIINSKEFNMDTETWSYVCYDKMLFSMVKYRGLSNVQFPITIKQFINKLCDKVGLEFEDSTFVNQDQLIYEDLYKNRDVTYRDIFDEISKIVAGNLLINDSDKLEVGYPNKAIYSENVIGSDITIEAVEEPILDVKLEGDTQQEGTPTPSNPQDINVVTGEQNIQITGKNLLYSNLTYPFTTNGVTVTQEEDGSITLNGTQSGGGIHIVFNNEFFDSIKNYVGREISISLTTNGEGSFSNFGIKNGTATDLLVSWSPSLSKTQTLNLNNYTNIYFDIWFSNTSRTFVNYNIKPQVEIGTTATTYEPYQSQNYFINLGKNLFDKDNMSVLNGYIWQNRMVLRDTLTDRIFYIPCQPNTTYTISRSVLTSSFRVATYNDTIPTVTSERLVYTCYNEINNNDGTTITITTDSNSKYLLVMYANSVNDTNIEESLATIQIEEGSQATTYEPYITPIELCKIGDYQDYIYNQNGNWYLHKEINKILLDGNDNKLSYDGIEYGHPLFHKDINDIIIPKDYSYLVVMSTSYGTFQQTEGDITSPKYMGNFKIRGTTARNRIFVRDDRFNGTSEINDWLLANNVLVYYVVQDATDLQITDTILIQQLDNLKNATLYNGVNNISASGDLPSILNLDYISEYESINEDYLKDTNVRMSEKIGVINSVAILDSDNDLQYVAEDTQSIKENEMTRITITDNLIAMNGETQEIADNILNKLNGLYYYANDLQTTGVCYYDYLDLFNVEARGNIYQCLLLNNEITITQGIEEHIFTEKFEELETNKEEYVTSVMTNKQASLKINRQEAKIEARVEKDGIISAINLSPEEIQIEANKISLEGKEINLTSDDIIIESNNFSVDKDGKITSTAGEIGGFVIGEYQLYGLHKKVDNPYIQEDLTNIRNYINGTGTLTPEQLEFYDYNKDGVVNGVDYIMISKLIENSSKEYTVELNSKYIDKMLNIYDENENIIVKLGANGGEFSNVRANDGFDLYDGEGVSLFSSSSDSSNNILIDLDATKTLAQMQINKIIGNNSEAVIIFNAKNGNISCVSLTQTSKEENKKNFEKLTNAKDILNQVDIYKYNFKDEDDNVKKSIGFVIGDNFNYSQEITSENNDGANIYSMVSVLWQVVKEQQEEINELKEMIKNGKY